MGKNRWVDTESWDQYDEQLKELMRDNDLVMYSPYVGEQETEKGLWYKSSESIT